MEHGEELPGRPFKLVRMKPNTWALRSLHQHVVTKPAGYDTVVHHWLIRLVFKITLPAVFKVGSWPALEFF